MGIEFGLFEHLTRPEGASLGALYDQHVELVAKADQAGVHGYFIAEHHGHRLAMAPSQIPWLAALARETERIRLGTLVSCLPLHQPLRLAEEVCMIDQLSKGRFELGVGRGISPFEHRFYGHAPEEKSDRFMEALELILEAFTTGKMKGEGRTWHQFPEVELAMETYQRPCVPIWCPGNVDFAGHHGFNLVLPWPITKAVRERYDEAYQQGLDDPGRLNPSVTEPKVASAQWLVAAETDAKARQIAERANSALIQFLRRSAGEEPPHLQGPLAPLADDDPRRMFFDPERVFGERLALAGSPETIRDYFLEYAAEGNANYFIVGFCFGDMTMAETARSLGLFLDEVVPALKASAAA